MFYYVYMLSDCATRTHHYVGMTSLKPAERLAIHNAGSVPHTSKFRPWEIDAVVAVKDKPTAAALEQYFKSGAGRAFANKHLFYQATTRQSCFKTESTKTPAGRKKEHLCGEAVLRVNSDQLKAVWACPRGGEKPTFPIFEME